MTRIAVDAMGGDHAPFEIIAGAVWAAAEYGVALELVGKQDRIEQCLETMKKKVFCLTAEKPEENDEYVLM